MKKETLLAATAFVTLIIGCNEQKSIVAPEAVVKKLADGFKFTEGPAVDKQGNIFFTDIPNNRIHKWSLDEKLTTFKEKTNKANGLFFYNKGNLIACVGGGRKLIAIDPKGSETVLVDKYKGKKLNSPNDLWIAPDGRIYFTDPRYGKRDDIQQDGEHVYCLDTSGKLIQVINDMVRPNGLVGTPDGKLLYVSDRKSGLTYVYKINADGTLTDKKLFAVEGSDGMTIDNQGNIYMTTEAVVVYNPMGDKIETINTPETPSNVCFGGRDRKTLFITARKSLYAVKMRVKGVN